MLNEFDREEKELSKEEEEFLEEGMTAIGDLLTNMLKIGALEVIPKERTELALEIIRHFAWPIRTGKFTYKDQIELMKKAKKAVISVSDFIDGGKRGQRAADMSLSMLIGKYKKENVKGVIFDLAGLNDRYSITPRREDWTEAADTIYDHFFNIRSVVHTFNYSETFSNNPGNESRDPKKIGIRVILMVME